MGWLRKSLKTLSIRNTFSISFLFLLLSPVRASCPYSQVGDWCLLEGNDLTTAVSSPLPTSITTADNLRIIGPPEKVQWIDFQFKYGTHGTGGTLHLENLHLQTNTIDDYCLYTKQTLVTMKNVVIEGYSGRNGETGGGAMRIRSADYSGHNASNPTLDSVTVQNNCRGFRIQDSHGVYVKNSLAINNTDNSFYFASGSYTSANGCTESTFDSCTAINSGQTGFMNIGGDENHFINCEVDGSRGAGFYNWNSNGNIFWTNGLFTRANTIETTTPWGGNTDDANAAVIGMSVENTDTSAILTVSNTHFESGGESNSKVYNKEGPGLLLDGGGNTYNMNNFPTGFGIPTAAPTTAAPTAPVIVSLPESDILGTVQNNMNQQPYSTYDSSQYITKLETQVSSVTGEVMDATFNVILSIPANSTTVVITGDLPAPFDLSATDFVISSMGNTLHFKINHEINHDQYKFGTISIDGVEFKLTIHNTDTETLIDDPLFLSANYLKVFDFNAIQLNTVSGGVSLEIDVSTAYYPSSHTTPRTFTALHIGQCVNLTQDGLTNFPTCGNIPSSWSLDTLEPKAAYNSLFGPSEPVYYNTTHLVDSNYFRYPVPPEEWSVSPIGTIEGLVVDGIKYSYETELNSLINDCKQNNLNSVSISNEIESIRYDFEMSIQLITPHLKGYYTVPPEGTPQYTSECRSQPYSISVSKTIDAVVSHTAEIATNVYVRSVTYVPCLCTADPAFAFDENVYYCDEAKTSYRLAIEILIDTPISGPLEGFVLPEDIIQPPNKEYDCFHFPKTKYWTAIVVEDVVRTTLTLYTDCFNIHNTENVQDCNRFNKCKKNGTVVSDETDYSIQFNLRQCTHIDCLQYNATCPLGHSCVDNPPDEVMVGIDIRLNECPDPQTFESLLDLSANASLSLFVNNAPAVGVLNEADTLTVSLFTGQPFLKNRMTTWMETILVCNTNHPCALTGTGCPSGVDQGCRKQQWETYCAFNGCDNPIIEEYPLVLNKKPYYFYDGAFETILCKAGNGSTVPLIFDESYFCLGGTCAWTAVGDGTDSYDSIQFKVRPLVRSEVSNWMIDVTATMMDCFSTRSVQLIRSESMVRQERLDVGFQVKEQVEELEQEQEQEQETIFITKDKVPIWLSFYMSSVLFIGLGFKCCIKPLTPKKKKNIFPQLSSSVSSSSMS